MAFKFFRDDMHESFATATTRRVRDAIESAGAEWGLGTFPNVETHYYAASEFGPMLMAVLSDARDDGMILTMWPERGLTMEEIEHIIRDGVRIGGAMKEDGSEDQQDQ